MFPERLCGQEAAAAQPQEPLFVNYGAAASIRQGDNDHHQAIYLSVPADTTGPLYVRIFDPDTFNLHDQMDKRAATTQTRFTVFGGDGAFIPEPTDAEALTEAELTAGTKLAEKTYGRDRRTDNRWVTLAEFDPAEGQRVGDRVIFRLVVDALSGPNGNLYDVALSSNGEENVAPAGLEMFAYTSTIRMPRRGVLTELRFRVPENQQTLTVGNFDAAFGEAYVTTPLAWYPLIASGQGEMQTTVITLPERDRGEIVAVTLSGGQEYPNDATFYVADESGRLLPFELPPRLFTLNNRPIARVDFDAPEVCGRTVSFSGDRTTDPEGDPLEFVWNFGDGTSEATRDATHTYAEDGRYTATMEVRDPGPQLGRGSAATVSLFLKEAPVALSEKRQLVGAGEATVFDGSPSTASKWQVASHRWDFGDGTAAVEGEAVRHAFGSAGVYTVTHTITDDSGHACNTASESFEVVVNAQPVAAAGEDRRIAIGEETVLDASGSTDSDGSLVTFRWDFGDGTKGDGEMVRHVYAAPGTYTVGLNVTRRLRGREQQRGRFPHHHRQRSTPARSRSGQVRGHRPDHHFRCRRIPRQRRSTRRPRMGLRRRQHGERSDRHPRLRHRGQLPGDAYRHRRLRPRRPHRKATRFPSASTRRRSPRPARTATSISARRQSSMPARASIPTAPSPAISGTSATATPRPAPLRRIATMRPAPTPLGSASMTDRRSRTASTATR